MLFRRFALPSAVAAAAAVLMMTAAQALPPTELMGDGPPPVPLKNKARIIHTEWGYRMVAGQQNSNITVTEVDGKLLFADTGTQSWRDIPKSCVKQTPEKGVAALCTIPAVFSGDKTMFIEIWPRLGDDVVDGSSLSAKYRLWVLCDKGNDTVYTGPGDDFVNGAQNDDVIYGNAGNDWLRGGANDDKVWGGDGNDKIVGQDNHDLIYGEGGDDLLYGAFGPDTIWGGEGTDRIVCGGGDDTAYVDGSEKGWECESVSSTT
ncbi:MAG: calcium-binding protein [Nocardioidaceae bacterium]